MLLGSTLRRRLRGVNPRLRKVARTRLNYGMHGFIPDSGETSAHPAGFALDTYAMPPLNVVLVQPGATPGPPPLGLPQWPAPGTAYVSPHLAEKHAVGTASPWGLVAGVIGADGVVNPNEQFVYANPGAYTIPEEYTLGHWGAPTGFSGDNRTNHPLWQFLAVMALMLLAPALYALRTATGARSPRLQRSLDIFEGFGAPDTFRAQVAVASILAPVLVAFAACEIVVAALLLIPSDIPLGFAGVVVQHRDVVAVAWWLLAAPVVAAGLRVRSGGAGRAIGPRSAAHPRLRRAPQPQPPARRGGCAGGRPRPAPRRQRRVDADRGVGASLPAPHRDHPLHHALPHQRLGLTAPVVLAPDPAHPHGPRRHPLRAVLDAHLRTHRRRHRRGDLDDRRHRALRRLLRSADPRRHPRQRHHRPPRARGAGTDRHPMDPEPCRAQPARPRRAGPAHPGLTGQPDRSAGTRAATHL